MLDTSRPTKNPLIQKIQQKTNRDNVVPKEEFKKQFRQKFSGEKRPVDQKKKKSEFHGVKSEGGSKKGKLKKKKQLAQKKVKKIAKILTGKPKE